ncbi:MAG: tetratricopeptide repeat protein [Deltaproteobacteria bacterium]|nr:tetratricopeptide repeat protein [Deltaproteobacteria bacterium]
MGRKKKKHTAESSKKDQAKKTHLRNSDRLRLKVIKPEILLIVVFILALFLRLVYLNQIISTPIFQGLAVDDEKYESFALQILKGNLTHKDFIYLNPLYPFFLSFIYFIFGQSHLSVVIVQAVIDSISCVVIYYIASLLFNKKVGIISALIYACYGIAIFYTGILLAPTVVIFLTLLFIASLLFAEEKRQVIIFFISGILFGLVVLARPNISLFLFLLPLWFFTVLKEKLGIHKSIKGILLLLLGFFMVTSLITIRNYSIEKRFSLSALGGINFYIGNNPEATGRFMSPHGISISPIEEIKSSIKYAEEETGKSLTPSQASRYWLFKGLNFIKDNPSDAFFLYAKKFALLWRKEEIPLNIDYSLSKTFSPLLRLHLVPFGIIAPLAILGIILLLKRKRTMLLILFIFSYMASVIIFFVSARYRLPIVPFLIICSSYALYRFVEMIRAKEVKDLTVLGSVLILLFVGINKNFAYFNVTPTSYHNNLGKIYSREGKLDKAIIELKKALLSNPHFVEAHCNLGITYLKKGLIKEAIYEYKEALKVNPNYVEAHYNLGNAYVKKGRLDEAISEFKRTLSINPNSAEARTNLGSIYAQKGRLDEAISEFKKTIAINPNFADAHTNLGVAYYYKGNYKLAIVHCDKAVDLGSRVNPKLLELLKPYR